MQRMANCSVSKKKKSECQNIDEIRLDLLLREKRLSEAKAREKFRQLVLAVEYIHSKNIVNDFYRLMLAHFK